MGFFKNIIADSRQSVRNSDTVGRLMRSDQSKPVVFAPDGFADLPGSADLTGADFDRTVHPVTHPIAKASGAVDISASAFVKPEGDVAAPLSSRSAPGMDAPTQRDSTPIIAEPGDRDSAQPSQSTVQPAAKSRVSPASTETQGRVLNEPPGIAGQKVMAAALQNDPQQMSGETGKSDRAVPRKVESVDGKQTISIGADTPDVGSVPSGAVAKTSGRVPAAQNRILASADHSASRSIDSVINLADDAPAVPIGHPLSDYVETAGSRVRSSPGSDGNQPTAQTDPESPYSVPDPARTPQTETKHSGAMAPPLPVQANQSGLSAEGRTPAHSLARPPQVHIGQVNVIVEAPASPQRQSQAAASDDSSSWLMLRSL
jgi:hypothetical protein